MARRSSRSLLLVAAIGAIAWLVAPSCFVSQPLKTRGTRGTSMLRAERTPTGKIALPGEDENRVLPDGVGI
eukprot:6123707-Amphidinium_carterae.1